MSLVSLGHESCDGAIWTEERRLVLGVKIVVNLIIVIILFIIVVFFVTIINVLVLTVLVFRIIQILRVVVSVYLF